MTNYYAEAAGNDTTGVGSLANPWKTYSKLMDQVVSGTDTLNLKYGEVYYTVEKDKNSQNGTSRTAPITVQPYGTSSLAYPSLRALSLLAAGTWVDTLITGGGNTVYSYAIAGITSEHGDLWVNDVAQTQIAWNTDAATTFATPATQGGQWAIDVTLDIIYLCSSTNPASDGKTYECVVNNGVHDYMLRVYNMNYWKFTNIDFQGGFSNTIWLNGNTANTLNDGIMFNDCMFKKSRGEGLRVYGTDTSVRFDLTVQDCVFSSQVAGHGIHGIQVRSGLGNTLLIERNKFIGVDYGMQIGPISAELSYSSGIIRRNLYLNCNDDGIWFGDGNAPIEGLTLDIDYNVIINCGDQGIQATGASADKIKRMRIRNNSIALCGQAGLLGYSMDDTCEILNNKIYLCNRQDVAAQRVNDSDYEIELGGARIDHNLVWADNNNITLKSKIVTRDNANAVITNYNDYAAALNWHGYRTAMLPNEGHSIFADPLLANATPTRPIHMRLRSNSPARGKGITTGALLDYEGHVVNNPPNIGAFERVARLTNLEVTEIVGRHLTKVEIDYDAPNASITETVLVNNCCGTILGVEHIPTLHDEPPSTWDLVINDEKGQDILRTVGANASNQYKFIQVEQITSLYPHVICTKSLQFVGTGMGTNGSSGKIVLYIGT